MRCVCRCHKDILFSDKEIASQQARIEKTKADPEKDEFDVRKQEEVLGEYTKGKQDEIDKLPKAWHDLNDLIVRAATLYARLCARPHALTSSQGLYEEDKKMEVATEEFTKAKTTVATVKAFLKEVGKDPDEED